jgi:hypothetical protein
VSLTLPGALVACFAIAAVVLLAIFAPSTLGVIALVSFLVLMLMASGYEKDDGPKDGAT